ncbi:multiheme c-type cytochrome [Polyangium fumosum]|uniref:Cytochrome c-552/4 domain-containing protein n=1 Tax=Polyangium fumosum TaxID=889272 RepID=A0A4U1IZC8_9BACT|nr:multiheme c-type cytochrome [Polyangium fumosum]TKD00069.1 hypothetical protein E8A74_35540 [Polyangium fumosum]
MRRQSALFGTVLLSSVALVASCAPSGGPPELSPKTATPAADPLRGRIFATLPQSKLDLAPAEIVLKGKHHGKDLADGSACEGCHADVAAGFRGSAHAFASFNNPMYRAAVDRFRADVDHDKSRFCGGCHDISLLVDGAMDKAIEPSDARAHAGIGCRTCHGIEEARIDGNGSYTLSAEPFPAPKPSDPRSIAAHKARAATPALRTAAICASCHRAFLNEGTGNAHHLIGQDDVTPWQQSVFAGSRVHALDEEVAEQDCRGCHMPRVRAERGDPAAKEGKIASHAFLGGHTWLAAIRKDPDVLAKTRVFLEGSVSIDIAAVIGADGHRTLPADGANVAAGERVVLAVALRNERVGHRFPGGTMDAADAWVEVEVRDTNGALVAEAGLEHEATGDDPTAHRLRALQVGDDGKPRLERQTEQFRAPVFNHTIPPRGAQVVEYGLEAPAGVAFPLRVIARLRHRTRSLPVFHAACEASKSERGKAFRAAGFDLDGCTPEPVTKVAEADAWIGPGSAGRKPKKPGKPRWRRLYDHGLGMIGALQERRDEAGPSLLAALAEAEATGEARPKAVVMAALALLASRQGRVDEAMGWLDKVTPLAPDHPAIPYLRGEALAQVWRFEKATPPLAEAAARAPGDDAAWVMLAIARGSAADARGALDAARRGLLVQPRDHDLLRVQALSLAALAAPEAEVTAAWAAWQKVRPADGIPRVKAKCSREVPGCALERSPVHVHPLRMRR